MYLRRVSASSVGIAVARLWSKMSVKPQTPLELDLEMNNKSNLTGFEVVGLWSR